MAPPFLPQVMPRADARLDFSPISQGLDAIRDQRNKNAMMDMRREEMDRNEALARERMGAAAARQNAMMAFQREQYQNEAPMRDARLRLLQAQAAAAGRGPGAKFFNTPSGVVAVGPDGEAKLIFQDPAAEARAEFMRNLTQPPGTAAPELAPAQPNAMMQPSSFRGDPSEGAVIPATDAAPAPVQPAPQHQGAMGLSPEARLALGATLGLGKEAGGIVYGDLTRGRDDFDKETNKLFAKEYADLRKQGAQAASQRNDVVMLADALANPEVYTGTGGKAINSLKKAAGTLFGLPVKGVAPAEIIDKTSKRLAIGLQNQLDMGKLSDGDREFLLSIQTGLNVSPEANRRLAQLARLHNQFQIDLRDAANNFVRQNRRLDARFAPIQKQIEDQFYQAFRNINAEWEQGGQQAPARSPAAGMFGLNDLRKRFGLE